MSADSLMRLALAMGLVALAAFCVFGFFASFEPGPHLVFQIGYPILGATCLGGAGWLVTRR